MNYMLHLRKMFHQMKMSTVPLDAPDFPEQPRQVLKRSVDSPLFEATKGEGKRRPEGEGKQKKGKLKSEEIENLNFVRANKSTLKDLDADNPAKAKFVKESSNHLLDGRVPDDVVVPLTDTTERHRILELLRRAPRFILREQE